jgi:hypothetical protein
LLFPCYAANAIFNAVYLPLDRREGEMAKLDDAARRQLMDLATLEILSKAFMAIEDLGKVLICAGKQPKDMPLSMLGAGEADSLTAIKKYAKKSEPQLFSMFPFVNPKEYGLNADESKLLFAYYQRCEAVAKKTLTFLVEFIDRHKSAHDKYKHWLPIIVAMGEKPPAEGIDGTMPIFTDTTDLSKVKFILTGPAVVDKLIGLTASVVDF